MRMRENLAKDLYLSGLSIKEIADIMAIAQKTVRGYLNRLGCARRLPPTENPRREEVEALYHAGHSQREIELLLDLPRNVIAGICWRAPRPPRVEEFTLSFPSPGSCLWINGEGNKRTFCGAPTGGTNRSWCVAHQKRLYLKVNPVSANQAGAMLN